MRELPYGDRLRGLDIFSFERRRLRRGLILAYNIFHGRLDLPQAEFFEASSERDLRGPTSSCATAVVAYSRGKQPSLCGITPPPIEIINSPTLDTLKRLLDLAWLFLFPSLTLVLLQFLFYTI